MAIKVTIQSTAWCPRCDRPYTVQGEKIYAIKRVEEHVKLAHPEMYEEFIDSEPTTDGV